MYSRYAERNGWKVDVMSSSASGDNGLKEVIAMIEGSAYSRFKYRAVSTASRGSLRQRPPAGATLRRER